MEPKQNGNRMKVKLSELLSRDYDINPALVEFCNYSMVARSSFALSKLLLAVSTEVRAFNKTRDDKVKEFGEQPDPKKPDFYSVTDPEKFKEFAQQIGELLDTEIELPRVQIRLSDLAPSVQPSAAVLAGVHWLLVDEEAKGEATSPPAS